MNGEAPTLEDCQILCDMRKNVFEVVDSNMVIQDCLNTVLIQVS